MWCTGRYYAGALLPGSHEDNHGILERTVQDGEILGLGAGAGRPGRGGLVVQHELYYFHLHAVLLMILECTCGGELGGPSDCQDFHLDNASPQIQIRNFSHTYDLLQTSCMF